MENHISKAFLCFDSIFNFVEVDKPKLLGFPCTAIIDDHNVIKLTESLKLFSEILLLSSWVESKDTNDRAR